MPLRTMAAFQTTMPDDTVENGFEIVIFGGGAVAKVIGEMLADQGFKVEGPEYAAEHGWDLWATKGGRRIWFEVTIIDDMLMQSEDQSSIWTSRRKSPTHADVLTRLHEQMVLDGRFDQIFWFTPAEYQAGKSGAERPLG